MLTSEAWLLSVIVPLVVMTLAVLVVSGRHRAVGLHLQHELRRRWSGTRGRAGLAAAHRAGSPRPR